MLIFILESEITGKGDIMKICIFGAASIHIDNCYIKNAEEMAERLANRGHSLVFGAGKDGVMGACARGFTRAGGEIVGVIPKFFDDFDIEVKYDKCTELIYTESMNERKHTMEELADAFLIAPGGIGTYEEFFEVLTLKQLGRHAKPIAIYNYNGYYDALEALLRHSIKEKFINKECEDIYLISDNLDEIIEYLETDEEQIHTIYDLKR